MRFSVLGRLQVVSTDGAELRIPQPRQRALLAVLLLHANQELSVSRLAESLRDEHEPAVGPGALRTQVWALRKLLGPARRLHTGETRGYQLEVRAGELDVAQFRQLAGQGRHALESSDLPGAVRCLTRALALWAGPPLADVPATVAMVPVAQRLLDERAAVRELLNEARLGLGEYARLIPELRESATADSANERLWEQLMRALHGAGRTAEALAAYQQARSVMQADLGLEPGHSLRQLHRRILAGDPELGQFKTSPAARKRPEFIVHNDQEPDGAQAGRRAARPDGPAPAGDRGHGVPGQLEARASVPRQLPAAAGYFIGRQDELEALTGLPGASAGAVVIAAIGGMPGIGKTALAVHAAHRLAGQFPDGQLFIDLHGYTQGHQPRTPGDALGWLLRLLSVHPQSIPTDIDERAALYRQRLAGTRTLIVLDNAISEEQVRPLLPGTAGCLVLVTSRRRLKGLDDARALALDVLPRADAITLLRTVTGAERAPAGDPVLGDLAELCGRLPLALRIAASLLRHRPAWPTEHLVSMLRAQQQGITALSDGDRDLNAVFGMSYHGLTQSQQSLFRHLGLIPGPDIDAYAAAALTGTDPVTASQLLENLLDHNLLIQHALGRYRLHDLIRAHAATLADDDPPHDRQAALDRLLGYYQHTANHGDSLIAPYPRPSPEGPVPAHQPPLPDQEAAWAWLRAERPNLLACLQHAIAHQRREQTIALAHGLATLLLTEGPWADAITVHAAAATAAHHLGDRPGRANALVYLADIRKLTGDHPGAVHDLQESLRLSRDLDDRRGQANALNYLAQIWLLTCDFAGAARDLQEALRLYRDLGERRVQANALTVLAKLRILTGHYPDAARDLQEAWQLGRDLDNRRGQACALCSLGEVGLLTGDYPGAARYLQEALRLYQDLGDPNGHGVVLGTLGQLARVTGDYLGAAHYLEAALDLHRRIGARGNEAWALNHYAAAISATGDHTRAMSLHQDALRLAQEINHPDEEAHALEGIAECHLHTGGTERSIAHYQQALDIFQRLAMTPDTNRVQARLTQISAPSA